MAKISVENNFIPVKLSNTAQQRSEFVMIKRAGNNVRVLETP